MAQSRSGKSTYKTTGSRGGSRSKSGSSSKARNTSARKQPSRRAQKRAQTNNLVSSLLLAGLGLIVIALVLVPGQSFWNVLRGWIFGVFGIITYLLGPFLLYLAYLLASGYQIGVFSSKILLMTIMCASVPVVFSAFTVGDSNFVQTVKMLFAWGQTRFWSGGVIGGPVGASLLALCGRPAANFLMILIFLIGLMVFFAVTPANVVEFVAYYIGRFNEKRMAARAEETAYDTNLFGTEPEEEPLENLTGPTEPPTTGRLRPGTRRAFDGQAYIEHDAARAQAKTRANVAAPVMPVAPVQTQPPRAEFDVELGPDTSEQALENAIQHDPLEPVVIGPGGTFGMDPLEQMKHRRKEPEVYAPVDASQAAEDNFELTLMPEDEEFPQPDSEDDGIDELIKRAMGNIPAEAQTMDDGSISSEVHLDVPDEAYDMPPVASPLMDPAIPAVQNNAAAAIPTIGGSFDVAGAAWNAGVPISDVLAGTATAPAVQRSTHPQPTPQRSMQSLPVQEGPRLRVSESVGNSATPPISTPPAAGRVPGDTMVLSDLMPKKPEPYVYPSLNLFNVSRPDDEAGAAREMKKNADVLVHTLDSFGVKTNILDICRGPSVTRYELQPQAGIKVSRITSLADDIALNLATAGVRIEAPIPGKPAVGIEVPNKIRSTVSIRGVFEAQNYINMRSPLTMALGKDIAGTAQVADLCKMPHLLIAGSTGSGKSVCVNSIIISFLFRSGPEDVKLILIDPKVVELAEYNGIPHLLMPVVTEPRKAAGALGASVAEMERRYKLFAENNVREIKSYNKLAKSHPELEHLPYIAIVIDELADLMMVAGKEVEDYICRIAQKARAAGIHLIVATQRPSVDVITGLIKANIPSRIAFAVSSQIDSRTILDSGGAEKLLGNGDMLFLPVGAPKPMRIQGTFVTDEEIGAVLGFIKSTSSAQYDEEMIAEMERRAVAEKGSKGGDDADAGSDRDAMFEQAVACVIEAGQASTSLLQRRCKLGYARAARIMDQMEQEGIIGPYEGAKPRAVLVSQSQWQERKLSAQNDE